MGSFEVPPLSRSPREPRPFPWTRSLLIAVVVLLAWIGYQLASKSPTPTNSAGSMLATPKKVVDVVQKPKPESEPEPKEAEPPKPPEAPAGSSVEHSAVQDFQLKGREAAPAALPPASLPKPATKKSETWDEIAQRCLEFTGSLVTTDPIVRPASMLVDLRVLNRCPDDFPGEHVWATVFVTGEQSGVVGSDFGHFSGTIVGYGSAVTRLEVACNPDLARSVLVRLRYFTP